ncbi:hypothetical protein TREMEDRAFT_28934 [Tremella mesenterica DSM 1558]|uniref:uncharacterized protein n=1 Tax=Tremella mesenterica (strain ATCC 24925 / CBS 8224 / DSM 1558 / NBRC 9311 / NRRL Y-6157 / RJB 2259-6 / UBC 559-6) TaxID=578456 RepID=UPI0003F4A09F|nr:uncharacterized protein TREMEDRAFT_28934 [Tremella mesenterica DSM 1558]EIW70508.1 hypothetical protein TREMEDRAFT_28934 [Tremella mesenterica DSM 1558]
MTGVSGTIRDGRPGKTTTFKDEGPIQLERRPSRLTAALTHVRSTEVYPPQGKSEDEETPSGEMDESAEEKKVKEVVQVIDIEHVPVEDDPREWSDRKKNFVLGLMTMAVLGPLIAPFIYNPVIDEIKAELHASDTQIALSISMYILLQGLMPMFWAIVAETSDVQTVYLMSYGIYTIGCLVGGRAKTIEVLIGMRCLQAVGSSAVTAVGAGSLADMYETHERGSKLGLFYGLPLMGPAVGPLIGGGLGKAFGWRSVLYFLTAFGGVALVMFCFFPDTYRKERSRVYQQALKKAHKRALHKAEKNGQSSPFPIPLTNVTLSIPTKPDRHALSPSENPAQSSGQPTVSNPALADSVDVEAQVDTRKNTVKVKRKWYRPWGRVDSTGESGIRPSLRDVNPFPTMWGIIKSPPMAVVLLSSGLQFASFYTITYTASITLAAAPYNYNPLYVGLVILSFGVGSMCGSLIGGRWSDMILKRLKRANGGVSNPEMRLKSTFIGMPTTIGGYLIYAWLTGRIVYSSTLAYIVDANPGRSSPAVSINSVMRGGMACIWSQCAVPLRNAIGDGGLYTMFAGLLALSCAGLFAVGMYGDAWRSPDYRAPWRRNKTEDVGTGVKSSRAVMGQE